jgi:uncharacterized protein with FMN-binding domain
MRRVILAICATAAGLVLLLSFRTHTQSAATGGSPAAAPGDPAPGGAIASASAAGDGPAKTVTGAAWPTIYGPVQVRITVRSGHVTVVDALEYPEETANDQEINAFAIPRLNQEALAADSAKIDTVSGATYTSGGYIGSLQNALDKAGPLTPATAAAG